MSAPVPNPGQNAADTSKDGGNNTGETPTGGDAFKPITSQEDLNKVIADRVARAERKAAEKFAGYDDLKAKAEQFDQLQESQKSAEQKTAERIAALEEKAAKAEAAALRASVQASFKISDEDAALFLTAPDREGLEAQAKRLSERDLGPGTNYVPGEGDNPKPGDSEERAAVRQLFAS